MKLLIDMNLSPRWVEFLRSNAFEAEHCSALGLSHASDDEIMHNARTRGFVVLTHDLDFGSILAATNGKAPSVVQIRARDISPEAIGTKLVAAIQQEIADLKSGALLTVDADRSRIRLLPLNERPDA
ncbi:MAG: DUF5615 family PIN-like protein [Hyphomicrobium sp.]|jgi:predicted nuclease of predicted toxin-antitoxin system